jgi:hypothetical protein
VPSAVDEARAFLRDKGETIARFDRVGELVEGFETPFGLELLATVHWVATREGIVAELLDHDPQRGSFRARHGPEFALSMRLQNPVAQWLKKRDGSMP